MAARRLVLNGLTAEVGAGGQAPAARAGSPDSLEFYHELELYRQLLALPPPAPPASPPASTAALPERRARTPDPTPSTRCHDEPRRSRTPGGCRSRTAAAAPDPAVRHARRVCKIPRLYAVRVLCVLIAHTELFSGRAAEGEA
ncbi:unnamed protein product [Chrysodeixis includens]|uniref:Uncharacterized protein n=1 Tax=Chrysodeixis includens TaxID=689277 RepID=A0A9N8PZ70_CHRIL|nr:unnamed protein product [Chrysodeixis includens]